MSLERRPFSRFFQILVITTIIITLGGGTALLLHLHQGNQSSQADGVSVIGPPSLPAAAVDAIFTHLGSPMVGTGKVVEQASRQTNIDDAFALGVWWTETNDGAAGVGRADRNPGSVRGSPGFPSAFDGYTIYPSYSSAVVDWFNLIRNRYVNRGLTTVSAISYPYVGTSSAPLWAGKVTNLMLRYRNSVPRPTPTPSPTPRPKPTLAPRAVAVVQTQETRLPTTGQHIASTSPSMMSATLTFSATVAYIIVFFGLLIALVIAAWAYQIGWRKAPSVDHSIQDKETEPRLLSVVVLSSNSGMKLPSREPVLVGGRSTGLLSRYGRTQQE